jgi:hypothetical protein
MRIHAERLSIAKANITRLKSAADRRSWAAFQERIQRAGQDHQRGADAAGF